MTSSGIDWNTLGFQMYQCQTIPWNFWISYEEWLRNVHPMPAAQWYVEFSGSPLLLPDNPFDYTGKLTRQISGNYTCRVYAKKQNLYAPTAAEDIIKVASAEGVTPNGCMEAIDQILTPRIEAVKQQVWDTLAVNEEKRWLAKQQEVQAAATKAAAIANNDALAAQLQAEADRLAAVNARDLNTKLAMQAAAAKTAATAQVKSFLNQFYRLPTDWAYDIAQTEQPGGGEYRLQAVASYYGRGDPRDNVPAGFVSVNPQLYGNDPVAIWNTLADMFPVASTSQPKFMLTVQACRWADGIATHLGNFDDLGPIPIMVESGTIVKPQPPPNHGYSSSGVQPWDDQPDVVDAYEVTPVKGTIYGSGYTASTGTTNTGKQLPPGFLDWLNLKVPDPQMVKSILDDLPSTVDFIDQYLEKSKYLHLSPPLPLSPPDDHRVSISDVPNVELFDDPQKPDYGEPQDGNGTLPSKSGQGSTFVQKPPSNFANIGANLADLGQDSVGQMLAGASTDFYNMLGLQYSKTLLDISRIASARAKLNELIEIDKPAKVEQFLRDFDAKLYAAAAPPPPPPPEVKAETKSNTMIWIGLGILVAFTLFSSRKATA